MVTQEPDAAISISVRLEPEDTMHFATFADFAAVRIRAGRGALDASYPSVAA